MKRRFWLGILTVLALGACGTPEPAAEEPGGDEEGAAAQVAMADEPEDSTPVRRRFLPDAMLRPGGRPGFSHDPHVEISCSVCHQQVRGHGSHVDLRCAQCHPASERAIRRDLSPQDCMACHHGAEQATTCRTCHEPPGPRVVQRPVRLSVWPSARTRSLPFDHARHTEERCEACHVERPSMAPTTSCGSCHESHHGPEADCASCHRPSPLTTHTLQAHTGCSGSGCHQDPAIEAMAQTRPVCLVCHVSQRDHEVGKECAECHQVRASEPESAAPDDSPPDAVHPWPQGDAR